MKKELEILGIKPKGTVKIPLYSSAVSAGFPSPADDYIEKHIDLNEELIDNATATICISVNGTSMVNANIYSGDVLIVDRSREPKNNNIVVGVINGDFTVKRISKTKDSLYMMPENKDYKPIKITEEMDFKVIGVVTYIIHKA
ncbi:MAG: LexA family protein [Bacteroidia bacterium]